MHKVDGDSVISRRFYYGLTEDFSRCWYNECNSCEKKNINESMPKFINIDHYFEASKLYQSLLTEFCLPRIFHTEKPDDYPNKGNLQSFNYKYPWTKIKADNDFILEEAKKSDAALEVLCKNLPAPISSPCMKVDVSQHSSPNKQHEKEQSFVLINLNQYRENLHLDHPCCLDEPLDVTEGLQSGPSLTFLLQKMKPLAVNDPFECDLKPDRLFFLNELEKCIAGMDQNEPKSRFELFTGKLDFKMVDLPKENLFSFFESKKQACHKEDVDSTQLSDNNERYLPSFCAQEFKENLVDRESKVETSTLQLWGQLKENSLKNDQLEPSKEETNSDESGKSLAVHISNSEVTPMIQSLNDTAASLKEQTVIVGQCIDENGSLFTDQSSTMVEFSSNCQPSTTAKHISENIGLSSVQSNNKIPSITAEPFAQNTTLAKEEFNSFHSPKCITTVQPKAEKLTPLEILSSETQKCNDEYSVIKEQSIVSYQPSTMTQCNSEISSLNETQSFSDYNTAAMVKSMNNPESSVSALAYTENKKFHLYQSGVENDYPVITGFCSTNQDLDIKQSVNIGESSVIVKSSTLKEPSTTKHYNQPSMLEYDVRDKNPLATVHYKKENHLSAFEESITRVSTMAEPISKKQPSTLENVVVKNIAKTLAVSNNEDQPANITFPGSKNSLTSSLQQNMEKSTTSEVENKSHLHDSKNNDKIHYTCDLPSMVLKTNLQETDSMNKLNNDQPMHHLKKESKSNTFNESKSERLDELLTNFIIMRKGKLGAKNMICNQEAIGGQEMKSKSMIGEIVKATVNESSVCLTSVKKQNSNASVSLKIKQSCSPKSQIKRVHLNGYYEAVAQLINAYASPVIKKLRLQNLEFLPLQSGLVDIDPDRTRFCLNQKLKECQDKNEDPTLGGLEESIYCQLLALHGYVKALECLLHCELTVSISCLKEFENTHHHILKDHFRNLLQDMKKLQCKVRKSNALHPKVIEIQAFVEKIFVSDRKCSAKAKILIVLKRHFDVVSGILKCALKTIQGINIILAPTEVQMDLEKVLSKTEESNIIVITSVASLSGGTIIPHFTTVLEYEFWNDSPVRQFCLTQNIDHYSFQVVLSQTVSKITYISELPEYILHILKEPTDECFPNSEENVCYTIGSKKITRNPELLHLLERKHGLTIIERNYQQILNFLPVEKVKLYYADLVLDEETGVIVLNTHDLEDYLQVNDVINKLIMLSMKFGRCWLIVYAVKGQEILNQVMRRNIVKIISIGMQFSLMKSGYQVQVVYATGNDQLAEFISAIAKSSQQTSKIWSNPDLGDRNWLRGEHSKHENFLLRFPCLNSICAQLMLSSVSLKELLTLSWNHLKNTFPWINVRILKIFYQFINQPSAVHQISLLNSASSQSKEHAVNEASSSNILKLSFPVLSEPESFDLLNLNKTNTTQQNCAATLIPYHSDNSSVGKNETQKSLEWPKHKHFKNEFQENRDALNLSTWNEIQSFNGNELHCIDNPVLEGTSRSTWLGQGSHNYAQNAGFPFSLPQTYYPFGVSSACVHRCCGQQCKTDNLSGGYPSCTDNALAEHYKSVLVPQLMLDHDFQDIKPSHGLTATDNLNYVCRGPDDMYTRKFMVVDNVSKCQQRIQDFSCLYKTELLSQKDASQKELQQWGQKNVQLAQEQFSSLYRMQQQGQERKTSDYIVSGRSNLPINFKSSCWKDNKLSQVDNDTKNSAEQPAIQRKLLSNVGIAYPFHQLSTCFDESPPMDLDCSGNNSSPDYRGDLKQHRLQRNNHVILMPHKKPRLAYEKVQGKKGQTRLVFH